MLKLKNEIVEKNINEITTITVWENNIHSQKIQKSVIKFK